MLDWVVPRRLVHTCEMSLIKSQYTVYIKIIIKNKTCVTLAPLVQHYGRGNKNPRLLFIANID